MKLILSFTILLVSTATLFSQSQKWTKQEIEQANTAKDADYLSTQEKQVILLINLARQNGEKFYNTYMAEYIRKFNNIYTGNIITEDNSYLSSLKRDLKNTKSLTPLKVNKGLSAAARYHAEDMGKTGGEGHVSSNGMTASDRGKKFAGTPYVGENHSMGHKQPVMIVGQLLLDDGIPSLGHRKNILDTDFGYRSVGVAIHPHSKWGHNCVIDFAAKLSLTSTETVANSMTHAKNKPAAPEIYKQKNRILKKNFPKKFVYDTGSFTFKKKKKKWEEINSNGSFMFKEISRKNNKAILFDKSRNVWLRLDNTKKICEYSEDKKNWVTLYYIRAE